MKSVSIDLSSTRFITGIIPLRGIVGVQMLSSDLSGDTTFNLSFSNDGENYGAAKEAGTAITDVLEDETVNYFSFAGAPGTKYKIEFEGATTGVVDIVVNGHVNDVIVD